MKILANLQDLTKEEWLSLRKIGASDVSTIMGLNKYKTPFKLFMEKLAVKRGHVEDYDNESMFWGRKLESQIAEGICELRGLRGTKCTNIYVHEEYDFLTCTPDFFIDDFYPFQIKNASEFSKGDYEDGAIADHAHVQVLAECEVLGAPYGYVGALIGGNKHRFEKVEADKLTASKILEQCAEFWRCVETETPPPLQAGDSELMSELHPVSSDTVITLGDEYIKAAKNIVDAKRRIQEEEDIVKTSQAYLKQAMGDAAVARVGGWKVVWKTHHRKAYEVEEGSYRKFELKEARDGKE